MEKEEKNYSWLKILLICFFSTLFILLYARYIEPNNIVVDEINIIDNSIPESFYGYKVAHISDIHYKTTISKEDLKKSINKINKSKPNIVIITGDIFDKDVKYTDKDLNNLIELLNNLDGKYRYIITGDQDLNNKMYKKLIENIDFKLLDNTYDIIYDKDYSPILIGGLSTKSDELEFQGKISSIEKTITEKNIKYNILIMHEPCNINKIDYSKFQLILAGHNNNGQVNIPGIKSLFIDSDNKKYIKTYYKKDNTNIYISKGLGTTGFKARLFNKPTINLYRLLNK